jgi:hypothetical protein
LGSSCPGDYVLAHHMSIGHCGRAIGAVGCIVAAAAGAQGAMRAPAHETQSIEMRNVDLRLDSATLLHVRTLRGRVVPTRPESPPALDDPLSFRIHMVSAVVALTGEDLAAILNGRVFAYRGAPLRDIRARTDTDGIIMTGLIHKGADFRFRMAAMLSVLPDGRIRLRPKRVRVLGLNGEKALHLVGLHLDNILDVSGAHGITAKGDDLFLDPLAILPPPVIEARLAAMHIEGPLLVQELVAPDGDSATLRETHPSPEMIERGFLAFRGGRLQFGRLLMTNTDLQILHAEMHGPFDLDLPHYLRQLVAGYSRTRADSGLTVFMPGVSAMAAGTVARPPQP